MLALKILFGISKTQEYILHSLSPFTISIGLIGLPFSLLTSPLIVEAFQDAYKDREKDKLYSGTILLLFYGVYIFVANIICLPFVAFGFIFMGICYLIAKKRFEED